jgi:hypothetical protein
VQGERNTLTLQPDIVLSYLLYKLDSGFGVPHVAATARMRAGVRGTWYCKHERPEACPTHPDQM